MTAFLTGRPLESSARAVRCSCCPTSTSAADGAISTRATGNDAGAVPGSWTSASKTVNTILTPYGSTGVGGSTFTTQSPLFMSGT